MADATHVLISPLQGIGIVLSRAGNAVWSFFISMGEARARKDLCDALYSKSDAELAMMGLKREDIVRHVFRDKIDF